MSDVKQIAGRAGRFKSQHPKGYVTCLWQEDLEFLRHSLSASSEGIHQACLFPR